MCATGDRAISSSHPRLPSAIGLSSQAGYTSTATIRFHFNEKGRMCGNSSTLGEASPKVDAHKTA
jgi:hypothetical protein